VIVVVVVVVVVAVVVIVVIAKAIRCSVVTHLGESLNSVESLLSVERFLRASRRTPNMCFLMKHTWIMV